MWICVNCGRTGAESSSSGTCGICGPDGTPGDPPRSRRGPGLVPALPIAVLIVALAVAGVLAGPRLLQSAEEEPTVPPPTPRTESATIQERLVAVDPAVSDPRAPQIAAMFETYFTGINEKDYAAVAGVFDPHGTLDPGDPEQLTAFSDGTATTEDSEVLLLGVADLADGRIRADVTFRSAQEPGDGPPGRPGETCTRWRVRYTLTTDDGYRIFRSRGASKPCQDSSTRSMAARDRRVNRR